jgi:hypothetical protein
MLKGTAPAVPVKGADRFRPLGGRFQYFQKFRFRPGFMVFFYLAPDKVSGRGQFNENALAFITGNARPSCGNPFHPCAKDFAYCHYYAQYTIIA